MPVDLRVLMCVVFSSLPALQAYDDDPSHSHPEPADEAETYRPTLLPDRIVLTWVDDPATTQAVTWRTAIDVKESFAEIAVALPGPNFILSAKRISAETQELQTNLSNAHYHTARFEGLKPSTKYAYRVGDGVNWSEWFHFSTASDKHEPFSFVYFGDAQNDVRSMWSRVIREAYGDAPDLGFFLHAGDLINRAESDGEWGQWFAAGKWLNAMVPSIAVPGNHEQAKLPDESRRLSHHWRPTFAFPEHGPAGLEETCYTIVYQGVRFVGLNSNTMLKEQAEWLDKVLSENQCRWIICTFHHPVYSTGKDRDNGTLRGLWKPIFDKYKVDLVLQGHDHTYGRTGLETPLVDETGNPIETNAATGITARDSRTGTIYVVSVSGPKMYSMQRHPFMVRQAEYTQLYQIIHVDGNELKYESRTAVGELYDAFTLTKQSGSINKLTNHIPDTPERKKPPEVIEREKKARAQGFMAAADANKDGRITKEEMPEKWLSEFDKADLNRDGSITFEELMQRVP